MALRCLIGVALIATLGLFGPDVRATTVIDFTLSDQVALAHDCVRVQVLAGDESDPERLRYRLRVVESVYGDLAGDFDLDLPARLVGVPDLKPGRHYVLFLNLNNRLERVIGHSWGSFEVRGENEEILDGFGQRVELDPTGDPGVNFRYIRQPSMVTRGGLTYPQFRDRIRAVRQSYLDSGGQQPSRPVQ